MKRVIAITPFFLVLFFACSQEPQEKKEPLSKEPEVEKIEKKASMPEEDLSFFEEKPELPENGFTFDKKFHNFGQVTMGDQLQTKFQFTNTTEKLAKITDMITTCGCTVADLQKFEYAPGEGGNLDVSLDTTLKEGLVAKTITLKTDIETQPEIHLSVTTRVKMPPHPVEKSIDIIMSEKCRLCHIEAGKDLTQGYLYHKICWQCHGDPMHPPKATDLFAQEYVTSKKDEEIYNAIANGNSETGMPRYLDEKEGKGLTKEQIESLVKFIRSKEKKG